MVLIHWLKRCLSSAVRMRNTETKMLSGGQFVLSICHITLYLFNMWLKKEMLWDNSQHLSARLRVNSSCTFPFWINWQKCTDYKKNHAGSEWERRRKRKTERKSRGEYLRNGKRNVERLKCQLNTNVQGHGKDFLFIIPCIGFEGWMIAAIN